MIEPTPITLMYKTNDGHHRKLVLDKSSDELSDAHVNAYKILDYLRTHGNETAKLLLSDNVIEGQREFAEIIGSFDAFEYVASNFIVPDGKKKNSMKMGTYSIRGDLKKIAKRALDKDAEANKSITNKSVDAYKVLFGFFVEQPTRVEHDLSWLDGENYGFFTSTPMLVQHETLWKQWREDLEDNGLLQHKMLALVTIDNVLSGASGLSSPEQIDIVTNNWSPQKGTSLEHNYHRIFKEAGPHEAMHFILEVLRYCEGGADVWLDNYRTIKVIRNQTCQFFKNRLAELASSTKPHSLQNIYNLAALCEAVEVVKLESGGFGEETQGEIESIFKDLKKNYVVIDLVRSVVGERWSDIKNMEEKSDASEREEFVFDRLKKRISFEHRQFPSVLGRMGSLDSQKITRALFPMFRARGINTQPAGYIFNEILAFKCLNPKGFGLTDTEKKASSRLNYVKNLSLQDPKTGQLDLGKWIAEYKTWLPEVMKHDNEDQNPIKTRVIDPEKIGDNRVNLGADDRVLTSAKAAYKKIYSSELGSDEIKFDNATKRKWTNLFFEKVFEHPEFKRLYSWFNDLSCRVDPSDPNSEIAPIIYYMSLPFLTIRNHMRFGGWYGDRHVAGINVAIGAHKKNPGEFATTVVHEFIHAHLDLFEKLKTLGFDVELLYPQDGKKGDPITDLQHEQDSKFPASYTIRVKEKGKWVDKVIKPTKNNDPRLNIENLKAWKEAALERKNEGNEAFGGEYAFVEHVLKNYYQSPSNEKHINDLNYAGEMLCLQIVLDAYRAACEELDVTELHFKVEDVAAHQHKKD